MLEGIDLADILKKIKILFLVSEAPRKDYQAQEKTVQVQTDLKIFYLYLYWALWIWFGMSALSNLIYKAAAEHYFRTLAHHA